MFNSWNWFPEALIARVAVNLVKIAQVEIRMIGGTSVIRLIQSRKKPT